MRLSSLLLFLHIAAVLAIVALSAVIHTAQFMMRRSTTVAEFRRLARPGDAGPAFGVLLLVLLGSGSWLVSRSTAADKVSFRTPFVWTGIVACVALLATGLGVLRPHHTRLRTRLKATDDGPIPSELRAFALSPTSTSASGLSAGLMVGVVFNMATKPDNVGCISALAVSAVVGALANRQMSRLDDYPV